MFDFGLANHIVLLKLLSVECLWKIDYCWWSFVGIFNLSGCMHADPVHFKGTFLTQPCTEKNTLHFVNRNVKRAVSLAVRNNKKHGLHTNIVVCLWKAIWKAKHQLQFAVSCLFGFWIIHKKMISNSSTLFRIEKFAVQKRLIFHLEKGCILVCHFLVFQRWRLSRSLFVY